MNDLKELGEQIKVLQLNYGVDEKLLQGIAEKYDALVNKPEYPDGTPGSLVIDGDATNHIVKLINLEGGGFSGTNIINNYRCGKYKHFMPLTTAILPHPVENTGVCPWQDGDEVRVEFENGEFATDDTPEKWNWTFHRGNNIVRSWLIKAAK